MNNLFTGIIREQIISYQMNKKQKKLNKLKKKIKNSKLNKKLKKTKNDKYLRLLK